VTRQRRHAKGFPNREHPGYDQIFSRGLVPSREQDWLRVYVSPSSGDLTLRLKHRADGPDVTLTVPDTSFTLAIPQSIAIDNINISPIERTSHRLVVSNLNSPAP
jgi:hypothetical protein